MHAMRPACPGLTQSQYMTEGTERQVYGSQFASAEHPFEKTLPTLLTVCVAAWGRSLICGLWQYWMSNGNLAKGLPVGAMAQGAPTATDLVLGHLSAFWGLQFRDKQNKLSTKPGLHESPTPPPNLSPLTPNPECMKWQLLSLRCNASDTLAVVLCSGMPVPKAQWPAHPSQQPAGHTAAASGHLA